MDTSSNLVFNNQQIWQMDYEEHGLVMSESPEIYSSVNPLRLKIRTILPPMYDEEAGLIPKEWGYVLGSVYCNDIPCYPKFSSTITKQNYISVPHHHNNWYYREFLKRGANVKIEVVNNDIDDLRISNNIDESYGTIVNSCGGTHEDSGEEL